MPQGLKKLQMVGQGSESVCSRHGNNLHQVLLSGGAELPLGLGPGGGLLFYRGLCLRSGSTGKWEKWG